MTAPIEQRPEDRLKLALLAHVRQDFSAPIGAIVGYAEILMEDAPRCGLGHCVADLAKIHEAGVGLQRLVETLGDPGTLAQRTDDYQAFQGRLRHDLRTPMNAIKGYGEMLLEDAEALGAAAFARDLEKLLDAAKKLLARIDALVAFAGRGDTARSTGDAGIPPPLLGALRTIVRPAVDSDTAKQTAACRILVVDDHESNRDLLSRRLTRERHDVVTAEDGEQALALLERQRFDLILLDLLMPGINGYEVLDRLKHDPRHSDIPVIMISALDEIDSVVRCIEAGAEDYLPKPFNPVLLRARINACLDKKRLRDREKTIMQELRIEKEKSDALLLNILPRPIVARLNLGESVIADQVADATILFADLVGFTRLSARLPPAGLVDLLNGLFSAFDRLSVRFGLEKIKTIGDAYMVAGGLLERYPDHVEAAADMALAMLAAVEDTGGRCHEALQIRIGMHTGPVVAGIIGTHKFIYDVWGDTVNTASRMESQGRANEINVSAASYLRLRDSFILERCGIVELAGKGPMETYFLRGRRPGPPRGGVAKPA